MKITLVTSTNLPGGFSIEAETPAEALILRMFGNDKRNLIIANFGGNILENKISLFIKHEAQETFDERRHLVDENKRLTLALADANEFLRQIQQGDPIDLDALRKQLQADWEALYGEGEKPCQ